MENIVTYKKLKNGKTLLIATNNIEVLYDEKEAQFINKLYKKRTITKYKKKNIPLKLLKQDSIPFCSKVESDELVSYFYFDTDKQEGMHIIISKIEPFADIKLYGRIHIDNLEALSNEKHLIQAKQVLKYAVEKETAYRTTEHFIRGNEFERLFYCNKCSISFEFPYEIDKTIEYKCMKCGITYEISTKLIPQVTIKEV